jgi:hypothetical protein
MATNFPASLDSLTNPSSSDSLNSPSHSAQHANSNDAIEALQAKVGVDSSAVTTSLDYKVANLESRPVETKTASYVLVAADVNKRIVMNNAGATTITVNDGVFAAGDTVWIHNIGAGTCTVTAGTATVDTAGSLDVGQWEGGSLYFTSASSAIFFRGGGAASVDFTVEYLVIGGGAGGANDAGIRGAGGGGAGGYRNSYASETSGRGSSTESTVTVNTSYTLDVTVGAGGAGGPASGYQPGSDGNSSNFGVNSFPGILSNGGGGGASQNQNYGRSGGCGGGGAHNVNYINGGTGTLQQGYDGGGGFADGVRFGGGGGGGVGSIGGNASVSGGGNGGNGLSSSITGSAVTRGGGGGGVDGNINSGGTGGTGGGGDGRALAGGAGESGTANTGGGGGAGDVGGGGNGGSGVIIIRYPTVNGLPTVGAGLTYSTGTVGTDTIITFTAGSDTITWS